MTDVIFEMQDIMEFWFVEPSWSPFCGEGNKIFDLRMQLCLEITFRKEKHEKDITSYEVLINIWYPRLPNDWDKI